MPMRRGPSLVTYLIFLVIIWVAINYLFGYFGGGNSVNLAYSNFKNQVKKGNVEQLTIKGNDINGKFKNDYIKIENSRKDTLKYKYFSSIKPSIYDPELMRILEQNNVTIHAENNNSSWLTYLLIMAVPWVLNIRLFPLYTKKTIRTVRRNVRRRKLVGSRKVESKKIPA